MPQENFTYINRSIFDWDGGSPNAGQSVNSDTTYVYTAALYPAPLQGSSANTLYSGEFIRLRDLLTYQQGLTFANRGVVGWGDGGSPNAGQSIDTSTSYILVAALYPAPLQSRPANTVYVREYIKIADLLTARQGLVFADRNIIGWGGGSLIRGQPVDTNTTYVCTPALYPAPLQGRPANTFYVREYVRLGDLLSAL